MGRLTRLAPAAIALTALMATPALAQARRGIDTKFERVEVVAGIRLIFCMNGQSYRVEDNVWNFRKYKTLWVVLKKGDKIHVIVEDGFLKGIISGWKKKLHVNAKILQTIRKLQEGDKIDVNGKRYQFIRRSQTHLTLSPKLPGGDFGYAGESRIPLGKVKKVSVVTDDGGDTMAMANDTLNVYGVVEGDTVELTTGDGTSYHGVVQKLTPISCELLRWTPAGRYGPLKALRRRDVEKARHKALEYSRVYPAGEGNLSLSVRRFRRAREGKTVWELDLSHDAPLSLLQPFKITFNLFTEVDGQQAMGEGVEHVQQLFPNKKIRVKYVALSDSYVDGEVVIPPLSVLTYSSDEAESAVLTAIDTGRNEDRLRGLYQGRLESKDPQFLHLLLSRVLVPPTGRSGADVHARLSEEMFRNAGERGAEAILHEITVRDDSLEMTNLIDGELMRGQLPTGTTPEAWRRKLIGQLLRQDEALSRGRAARLFEFYCANEIYNLDVEKVFQAYPNETVQALFELAIPRQGVKGAQKVRQGLAVTLLRNLKDAAFPQISKELDARQIDGKEFETACRKYGSAKAEKAIDVALKLAAEASRDEWLAGLDKRVDEARELARNKKLPQALELLREILGQKPDLESARKAFPGVAVKVAASKSSGGEACALLEEAIQYSGQGKTPLAQHLLRGVRDDIKSIVVRDGPTHGGTVLMRMEPSQVLAGQREGDWVKVVVPNRKKPGYVHGKCLAPRGEGEFGPMSAKTPPEVIERAIERIKQLSPDLSAEADLELGNLYARDGHALFVAGKYELAAPLLEKAEALAPDNPLLAETGSNWLKANANLILLVLVFLGITSVAGFMVYKRLKAELGGEDLEGLDLEIVLELGVDEEHDDDDDDDDEDFVFANAGAASAR